jgi:hypothetical protein
MTQPRHAAEPEGIGERFVSTFPRKVAKHVTEDDEFVAGLQRWIRALEARAIDNPETLVHVKVLQDRLAEVTDVVIAVNAERHAMNPMMGISMAECGRILGWKSKQVASYHRAKGVAVIAERLKAAGAVPLNRKGTGPIYSSEARRERDAREAATAQATDDLAAWRARKSA